jgi:fatty-acyl-CoA synthase
VWFVDAFPVTQSSNGVKIQRARLRDLAIERLRDDCAAHEGHADNGAQRGAIT